MKNLIKYYKYSEKKNNRKYLKNFKKYQMQV